MAPQLSVQVVVPSQRQLIPPATACSLPLLRAQRVSRLSFRVRSYALVLRSDRDGKGDGRVYHVGFEARDVLGAACAGEITVCVPHDARKGAACGDGGAVVDSSFGG